MQIHVLIASVCFFSPQKFDIWPILVRVDYSPSRVDLAALRGGKYVELVNLVPWKVYCLLLILYEIYTSKGRKRFYLLLFVPIELIVKGLWSHESYAFLVSIPMKLAEDLVNIKLLTFLVTVQLADLKSFLCSDLLSYGFCLTFAVVLLNWVENLVYFSYSFNDKIREYENMY